MRENFAASLEFVLKHECAYEPGHYGDLAFVRCENVPGDAGGSTKYGIDAADHPGLDIANLSLGQATAIYQAGEWTACRCDDLPLGIDTAVFDCAVNNGSQRAGILLQRALVRLQFGLGVDGVIGRKTVAAAMASRSAELIAGFLELRREYYGDIVLAHPGDGKFLGGWLNRVDDLESFLQGNLTLPKG